MKHLFITALLPVMMLTVIGLYAQAPQFEISVPPTQIMASWYDYMIGGYMDTPVAVQSSAMGGDVFMLYHSRMTATDVRKLRLARISESGTLLSNHPIGNVNQPQGFPSLALDTPSGTALYVWHEAMQGMDYLDVGFDYGPFEGIPNPMWVPQVVIDNTYTVGAYTENEFIWPSICIGASPLPNKRRAYVLARNSHAQDMNSTTRNMLLAYADFTTTELYDGITFEWTYVTIPELDDWFFNADDMERRFNGSLVCKDDGKVYLIGNHNSYTGDFEDYSQYLTVFINDNYGSGAWRRISASPNQSPSQVTDSIPEWAMNEMVFAPSYSDHFNAVLDNMGRIHFPQLFTATLPEDIVFPMLHSVRDLWFDTVSETFSINDLFPQGASPHSDPCYTPWDVNEDNQIDAFQGGYPLYPSYFPFPYWDQTALSGAMMSNCNLLKMTRPTATGAMACVWSDSRNAVQNPDYPGPETYISVSPNNGFTWLPPIVLNPLDHPTPNGCMIWAYPASEMIQLGLDNQGNSMYRLFLMFYDDNTWGPSVLSNGIMPMDGGAVSYMAVDIHIPALATADPVIPAFVPALSVYPNPFNPSCTIRFNLPKQGSANLSIYNVKGQKVRELVCGTLPSGENKLNWDGKDASGQFLSSGLYFAKLDSASGKAVQKLLMVK